MAADPGIRILCGHAHDRRGLQAAGRGVRRHLDLQDPVPGGSEADRARPHAGRLPAVFQRGRRAPAVDPAPAAGRVPAAGRDPRHAQPGPFAARRAGGARGWCGAESAALVRRVGVGGRCRAHVHPRADRVRAAGAGPRRRAAVHRARTSRSSRCAAGSAATASPAGTCGPSARRLRREAGLLEQILAPALRSQNPERREAGMEELEALAELISELTHLLLVRDLRQPAR